MLELSVFSKICLYVILATMGVLALVIWIWQIMVLKGKAMANPDGSFDDRRDQKILFGIAFADVILACPATVAGIVLVFVGSRWGFFLLAMVSFWFVWANVMTTVTSLRFEKPKITLNWLVAFPLGICVGLAYIAWALIHFDTVFLR